MRRGGGRSRSPGIRRGASWRRLGRLSGRRKFRYRVGAFHRQQCQRALCLRLVDLGERIADVEHDVVSWLRIVDERDRDFLDDAAKRYLGGLRSGQRNDLYWKCVAHDAVSPAVQPLMSVDAATKAWPSDNPPSFGGTARATKGSIPLAPSPSTRPSVSTLLRKQPPLSATARRPRAEAAAAAHSTRPATSCLLYTSPSPRDRTRTRM